jgi:hypothetical protein
VKRLAFLAILVAVTGMGVAFRNLSGSADASRPDVRRAAGPAEDRPPAREEDGPALSHCAAGLGGDADAGDLLLARLAAECGNHLFGRAVRSPGNPHLIQQAAQHYRACLAHEPTTPDAGGLYRDARARLQQLDRLLARQTRPPAAPRRPAPAPGPDEKRPAKGRADEPAAVKPPAPVPPVTDKEDLPMVGPDGVTYRRSER